MTHAARTPRVLLAASDVGSGRQLAYWGAAMRRQGIAVEACAGRATRSLFAGAQVPVQGFPPEGSRPDLPLSTKAIEAARAILSRARPSLLITGISHLSCSVDRAFLHAGRSSDLSRICLYLDGPVLQSKSDDTTCDTILTPNAAIADWACAMLGKPAVSVGFAAATLPADALSELRRDTRARLGLADQSILLGFASQTNTMAGHLETFTDLAKCLENLRRPDLVLAVRPHPGDPASGQVCMDHVRRQGVVPIADVDGLEMMAFLAACDMVLSCNSGMAEDHWAVHRAIGRPYRLSCHLSFRAEFRSWMQEHRPGWRNLVAEHGRARDVSSLEELQSILLVLGTEAEQLLDPNGSPGMEPPDLRAFLNATGLAEANP